MNTSRELNIRDDLASGTPRENQEDESGEVQQSTEMTQSGRVETKTTDQSKKRKNRQKTVQVKLPKISQSRKINPSCI